MTMIDMKREKLRKEFMLEMLEQGWTPPEKTKKYMLSYDGYVISPYEVELQDVDDEILTHLGFTRKSYGSAQLAAERMRRMMPLSALAAELGGEKEFVYGDLNYYVYKGSDGLWNYNCTKTSYNPERVYMVEYCAAKICRMLNSGEFEL